jgi:hypothetical protein
MDGKKWAWSVRLAKRAPDDKDTLTAYYTIVAESDALMRAKLNELAGDSFTIESITRNVGVVVDADAEDEG